MSKQTSPPRKTAVASTDMTKSLPASQSKASSAPALKRPIPAASVARAKKAFRNFSLSRFAGSGTPSNYVAAGQNPAEVQRKKITQHLENVSKADRAGQGMTIALPDAMIKKLLPSFNAKAGTIDLGEVITLVQQNMRGTEFYSNGHPTLNRLAIQSQVQQIINSVKKGGQK